MESTEIYTETQGREGREADAQERDRDTSGESGDRVADLLRRSFGFDAHSAIFDAICPSTLTASREVPNGYDDVDEEIEDEYEIDEITD